MKCFNKCVNGLNRVLCTVDLSIVRRSYLDDLTARINSQHQELQDLKLQLEDAQKTIRRFSSFDTQLQLAVSSAGLPAYITQDFGLRFKLDDDQHKPRCVILSVPKAGTYLTAKIFEALGFVDLELHISSEYLADYRWMSLEEKREYNLSTIKNIPINQVVKMIAPGQFVVGHIPCSDQTTDLLEPFKRVFLKRNLRDGIVSYMRFCLKKEVDDTDQEWKNARGKKAQLEGFLQTRLASDFLNMSKQVVSWSNVDDTLTVAFEKLLESPLVEVRRIADYCGIEIESDSLENIVQRAFDAPNTTYSGPNRSDYKPYWNDAVESEFCRLGGAEINHCLGYC